ncbi:hypothetical protein [Leptolyngbya sp. NIES-2104]|uniref:hypothetical protein n=1 Tax=Leptolyngbya sp. NIES-2104 TaxID=1552121 RepID=UPI0006ECAE4A|nr:hypothetical protein [Leptolyngbya sp. NIES-2104]GAP94589.1 hypothetical protein NIES2104_11000 [Leptolyngbya sp. NIES-2104]
MPTILNDTLKAELEQTRARLLSEQETIAETVTKEAEAEIDRVLGYINSLLGEAAPTESAPESKPATPSPAKTTAKKTAAPKSSSKGGAFDAGKLKSKFKDLKPMDAILKVLADEKSALSIDDLINQLYDEFDAAEISKARRSVAITTKHAERRGLLKKVQDNPSRFQGA